MRPKLCRKICGSPTSISFKPMGFRACELEKVVLDTDEFEAIRLADYEGLYQEEAAKKMGISRQTFGRIIESAHKKIAEALVCTKVIRLKSSNEHDD